MNWYRLAADQGNVSAQSNLGIMYENGQDYAEAVKWYRLAADQGNAFGQYNLGSMYIVGRGVPQDYVLAYMWLNLSAAQGKRDAKKKRAIIARRMTAAQIQDAKRLAREWRPTTQPPK